MSGHEGPIPSPYDDEPLAEDENNEEGIANVIEALAEHYNEPYRAVLDWPWKLFCARWRRILRYSHDQQVKAERREREQDEEREWSELQAAHNQRMGKVG